MTARKKIYAIISYPFLPATTGGEISTLQILSFLGKKTDLTVFAVDPYQPIDTRALDFKIDFGMRFTPWRYLNLFLLLQLIRKIKNHQSDAIFFDQPFMGWMIPFLRLFTGKKVFLRSNNIEYLRFKSLGKQWWSLMYMYEKMVYRFSNLVIFVSDIDQKKAISEFDLNPEKTLLTPYGIPQQTLPARVKNAKELLCSRHGIEHSQKILLFFATLNYQPNWEAVVYIADEIYPRLIEKQTDQFVILICGKKLPDWIIEKLRDKKQIQYLGFVEDIETYIDGSDMMINPILSGGGIKTKAIDTLGRGQVVISTATGAEGIDPMVCGKNLRIAADKNWDQFIQLCEQQLEQPEKDLPQSFFETYSWPGIVDRLIHKLDL